MTDTTRKAFEAWHSGKFGQAFTTWVPESGRFAWDLTQELWLSYQAATERATAIERERCAVVCDSECARYASIAAEPIGIIGTRANQAMSKGAKNCAAAIRQGGVK